jgi:hypothetical protein
MEITRDVFPTDDRSPYLTLTLASRDLAAHNLLTGLESAERERIAEALGVAAAAIIHILGGGERQTAAQRGTANFGCGT